MEDGASSVLGGTRPSPLELFRDSAGVGSLVSHSTCLFRFIPSKLLLFV